MRCLFRMLATVVPVLLLHIGCGGDSPDFVCADGECAQAGTVGGDTPPSDPLCYTPCKSSAVIDGEYMACGEDGLMRGCVAGARCVNGSCLAATVAAASAEGADGGVGLNQQALEGEDGSETNGKPCESDPECAEHQRCIQGYCYSDCEVDTDCKAGKQCYLKVCRQSCQASADPAVCEEKYYCRTTDGDTGYCMPLAEAESQGAEAEGSFLLSEPVLKFSNVADEQTLTVTNNSPLPMKFTVRKVDHTEFTDEGPLVEKEMPLFWLSIVLQGEAVVEGEKPPEMDGASDAEGADAGVPSEAAGEPELMQMLVPGEGGTADILIGSATNENLAIWNGTIEVGNDQLGYQRVTLSYSSRPEGQWAGKMYYFANFGTDNLQEWMAEKDTEKGQALIANVGNAIIWRWGALRRGQISFDNFMASVEAMKTGSWKWPNVQDRCPEPLGACYLYDDPDGLESFTNDLQGRPIPTGMSELPIVMNLHQELGADPKLLTGKVVSSEAMHYAGYPQVQLSMAAELMGCASELYGTCVNYITDMQAQVIVGGRYYPGSSDQGCTLNQGFESAQTPWLVPGFTAGAYEDRETGKLYRQECRDNRQPYDDPRMSDLNATLSAANPVPDGRSRIRTLSIVDGALINQKQLVIFFQESFTKGGAVDEEGTGAYGLMVMERSPAALQSDAYDGSQQREERDLEQGLIDVRCSEDVIKQAFGISSIPSDWTPEPVLEEDLERLAWSLIVGADPTGSSPTPVQPGESVHYLCNDTGLFDGGPEDDGTAGAIKDQCPAGSNVSFFTIQGNCMPQAEIAALPCQTDGSCGDTLAEWQQNWEQGDVCQLRLDPLWRCTDPEAPYCDDSLLDLREGKTFFAESDTNAVFIPLRASVDAAFRYKTAFRSRKGKNIGFTPDICDQSGNSIPYCYDPGIIEQLQERIDCALSVFLNHRQSLSAGTRALLQEYLVVDFSVDGEVQQRDGFEALLAELLVMLGDDSYTQSFMSRFDLASTMKASFEGSLFEPGGIDISGIAGYEMYSLYQAVQYYQMALDRFYQLSPAIEESLLEQTTGSSAQGFITQETVTSYLDRLIRASSQKARAWSEIARRYQTFNQPDLARLVVERAYTATYMESVLIAQLMHSVSEAVKATEQAQILYIIEQSQRQYRAALLDMRDVYKSITDEVNYWGMPPDFVPFPAMDLYDINAFEKQMEAAFDVMWIAADKENLALESTRTYDVDAESFQAEMVNIRNNYDNQLAELCGTFVTADGNVYPAIVKYAYMNDSVKMFGDPCGQVGNGAIYQAMGEVQLKLLELKAAGDRIKTQDALVQNELTRISEFCGEIDAYQVKIGIAQGVKMALQVVVNAGEYAIGIADRALSNSDTSAELMKCIIGPGGTNCPQAAAGASFNVAMAIKGEIAIGIASLVRDVAELGQMGCDVAITQLEMDKECDLAKVDSRATITELGTGYAELINGLKQTALELQLTYSEVEKLQNEATRVQLEREEAEMLTINIEAARNDPNVRIYKNDAVINAEIAFDRAMLEAYRSTKLFEYFTSQSYARMENLFLIRMVTAGDYNLENYLLEMDATFGGFEEDYGNPDKRVEIISLRDDIWDITRLNGNGESLSENERNDIFRQKLSDPSLLDASGYITIPFSTRIDQLSPLTRNHKIRHIEAEYVGSDLGDAVGRVYLRTLGTGTVAAIGGGKQFYSFPERTAVVNTFFNGERPEVLYHDSEFIRIFENERFRDRPFANSLWEMVINQRDEAVNKDINLMSLTDVRLYIYYSDYTEM